MRVFGDRYRVEVRMDPAHDDVVAILAPRVVGGGKIVEAIWLVFLMRLEGDDPDWQPWGGGLAELAEQRAHLFEVENCFPPFPLTSGGQQIEISGLDLQPLLGGESRLLPDKRRQQSEPKGPLHSGHKGTVAHFPWTIRSGALRRREHVEETGAGLAAFTRSRLEPGGKSRDQPDGWPAPVGERGQDHSGAGKMLDDGVVGYRV